MDALCKRKRHENFMIVQVETKAHLRGLHKLKRLPNQSHTQLILLSAVLCDFEYGFRTW